MPFWGLNFIFDGTPSETFGLIIGEMDASTNSTGAGSSNVELLTETVFKRPKPYFFGAKQAPVLEFDISFLTQYPFNMLDVNAIQSWLFGHPVYKKLEIVQSDMDGIYVNCMLTNPVVVYNSNMPVGFSCHVICDSPFAYGYDETKTYTFTDINVNRTEIFVNESANNFYTYPRLILTVNSYSGIITITNLDDNSRQFVIGTTTNPCLPGEQITFDNDLGMVTTTSTQNRMSSFNKNWFRMVRGVNRLKFQGMIATATIIYAPEKKIGG